MLNPILEGILNLATGHNRQVMEQRVKKCSSCKYLAVKTGWCMKCGCGTKFKASVQRMHCPLGNW